jgi:hypothetical protein
VIDLDIMGNPVRDFTIAVDVVFCAWSFEGSSRGKTLIFRSLSVTEV